MSPAVLLFVASADGPEPVTQNVPPSAPAPAPQPEKQAKPESDARPGDIVVTARRLSGSAIGNIAPSLTLDAAAIQALGGNNLADIVSLLGSQLTGSAGRGGGDPFCS